MDELDHLLQRINGRASFPGVVDDRLGQHNTVVKGVLVNDEGLVLQDLGEKAACVERRKGGGSAAGKRMAACVQLISWPDRRCNVQQPVLVVLLQLAVLLIMAVRRKEAVFNVCIPS